jgi:tRNA-dihydrouridine synthase
MFTEFTTTVGMFYAPEKVLRDFELLGDRAPHRRQVYGNHPDDFYRAAHVVAELGFDGLDINMGCPAKQVTQKNCGAALIRVPELALDIVRATRSGLEDWARGQTLESLKIPERVISVVAGMNFRRAGYERPSDRKLIPYSVKTRLGFDEVVIEDWVKTLLSERPAVISVHGRTLKQMYKGAARWDDIARAANVARGTGTLLLGNGDLPTLADAHRRIEETGVDGVLIGRASLGNPWVFRKIGPKANPKSPRRTDPRGLGACALFSWKFAVSASSRPSASTWSVISARFPTRPPCAARPSTPWI